MQTLPHSLPAPSTCTRFLVLTAMLLRTQVFCGMRLCGLVRVSKTLFGSLNPCTASNADHVDPQLHLCTQMDIHTATARTVMFSTPHCILTLGVLRSTDRIHLNRVSAVSGKQTCALRCKENNKFKTAPTLAFPLTRQAQFHTHTTTITPAAPVALSTCTRLRMYVTPE